MRKILFLTFCIVLLSGTMATLTRAADFPPLISSIRINPPVDFCGEPVPLDNQQVYEGLEKELLLFAWNRSQVILWLKRTGRYMPYIEKTLRENGMPDDLKYSAVVESSLIPYIRSSKYATGFWQFIKSTGTRYGLTINSVIDERRNLHKSTGAAVSYLRDLYSDFGSWTLSVAAYNMGESGLRKRIKFQKTDDFYNLYLPLETQRHILKIVAVKMLLANPEKYGFHLTQEDFYRPVRFDRVQVDCPRKIPLPVIAEAAGTHYKTIRELNPEVRNRHLPPGTYSIAIPEGSSGIFHARYKTLHGEWVVERKKAEAKRKKSLRKGKRLRKKSVSIRSGEETTFPELPPDSKCRCPNLSDGTV